MTTGRDDPHTLIGAYVLSALDDDERHRLEAGRVTQLLAGDIADAVAVGVTVEPDGGSAQPTSDSILAVVLS